MTYFEWFQRLIEYTQKNKLSLFLLHVALQRYSDMIHLYFDTEMNKHHVKDISFVSLGIGTLNLQSFRDINHLHFDVAHWVCIIMHRNILFSYLALCCFTKQHSLKYLTMVFWFHLQKKFTNFNSSFEIAFEKELVIFGQLPCTAW